MYRILLTTALFLAATGLAKRASATTINFETDPTGAPSVDDYALNTPYPIAGGSVRMYFDTNPNLIYEPGVDTDPIIEQIGTDGTDAFTNSTIGGSDLATPPFGPQLGNFFLRHPSPGPPPPALIIDYNTVAPITALGGEIWDIDGQSQATEAWRVDVLDSSNTLLTFQDSPVGNNFTMDGKPWAFSFSGLPAGVDKLRITFQGTKINATGLAFNNFSPFTVPEPGSIVMLASGALATIALGLRNRLRR